MADIKVVLPPHTDRRNDPSDHRDEPGYLERDKPIGRTRPRVTLKHVADLDPKPTKWLVYGLLQADALSMLYGEWKTAKSFVAVDMALCVAAGIPFHGLPTFMESGCVIYLAGEGHSGIAKRAHAWADRNGVELKSLHFHISDRPVAINDGDDLDELLETIDAMIPVWGTPVLVVVDTLARNFGPGDESSTRDMNLFVSGLDRIRARYQCAVLPVHHTGHGNKERARGGSSLPAALDASFKVTKDPSGLVTVEGQWMKDAATPAPMAFRLSVVHLPIEDALGNRETTCVLEPVEYVYVPPVPDALGVNQKKALGILKELHRIEVERLEDEGLPAGHARVSEFTWRKQCTKAGLIKQRVSDAKRGLKSKGLIDFDGKWIWPR